MLLFDGDIMLRKDKELIHTDDDGEYCYRSLCQRCVWKESNRIWMLTAYSVRDSRCDGCDQPDYLALTKYYLKPIRQQDD